MRIGILTHPLRFNYGGVLQNFALQHVLRSYGHEVYTIDWNDDKSYIYKVLSYWKRLFAHYILKRSHIPTNFHINLTREQFLEINEKNQKFFDKHINRTEYISSISKLSKVNNMNFDAIVVGSDQVWIDYLAPTMFLDFLDERIKRMAYAASFGKSEWTYDNQKTKIVKDLVNKFIAVSVRENTAVELCANYLEISTTQVLDPTLLLSSQEYNQLIDASEDFSPSVPYLMRYILDDSSELQEITKNIENQFSLKTYEVKCRGNATHSTEKVCSVATWLSGFKNADFVITDSFHGTVFSIIYKKPFIVVGNTERGMARFTSLLGLLGLNNRLLSIENNISEVLNNLKDINYDKVNELLEKERSSSLAFISNALEMMSNDLS